MSNHHATLSLHHAVDDEVWSAVNAGLGEFNAAAAPLDEVKPLACCARSAGGEIIGGVIGRTWGKCCEMLQLWVADEYRHQGIGSALVANFHEQGEARGCRSFYLDTFSFQAPEFYRRLGYEVRWELPGYTQGIVKYVMVREVPARVPQS